MNSNGAVLKDEANSQPGKQQSLLEKSTWETCSGVEVMPISHFEGSSRGLQQLRAGNRVGQAWSVEKELTLIELYSSQPLLWDPSHSEYLNKTLREKTLQEFSQALRTQVGAVTAKIHSLRTYFFSQLKKESAPRGGGIAPPSQWHHMEHLSFLRRASPIRRSRPRQMRQHRAKIVNQRFSLPNRTPAVCTVARAEDYSPKVAHSPPVELQTEPRGLDGIRMANQQGGLGIGLPQEEDHGVAKFGTSVAQELKGMHPYARDLAKVHIQQILFHYTHTAMQPPATLPSDPMLPSTPITPLLFPPPAVPALYVPPFPPPPASKPKDSAMSQINGS
uniref:uncharacterized protein isoform X2 n=1 Tax=Myxine glutinosa TaxID=7769 RepID=UPI00358FA8AF